MDLYLVLAMPAADRLPAVRCADQDRAHGDPDPIETLTRKIETSDEERAAVLLSHFTF